MLVVGWAGACANQGVPPGGPEDQRPPVVVRTDPEAFAVLADLSQRVRFDFDERISEQVTGGSLQDAVTVSPETGEVRVSHGSRSLSVEVRGGFRPGLVYRVTLLPVVSDLFGNQLRDPFELVFSTGGTPTATTLAGQVWDRITGRGVGEAWVRALGQDSLVHLARADDQGIFALRYVPDGTFLITGFDDLDRNGEAGAREVQGSVSTMIAQGDTVLVDIPVLAPDTTAALLAGASALDSVTILLEFDDYLDPEVPANGISVELSREAEAAPRVSRVLHEPEYAVYVGEVLDSLARLDSLEAAARAALVRESDSTVTPTDSGVPGLDSVPALDSVTTRDSVPAPDTVVVAPTPGGRGGGASRPVAARGRGPVLLPGGRGRATGVRTSAEAPGRELPGRRLVGLLDAPLDPGSEYAVRVSAVVNLNGLPEGGGEAVVVWEPPSEAGGPDSSSVAPDTASAADTASAPGPGGAIR